MAQRDLVVRFLGDDRQLSQAFTRQERRAQQFSGRMDKVGQSARGALSVTGGKGGFLFGSGAFIASATATAAITKSISAASDLNEQLSKSNVVFGKNAKEVESWSKTLATSFGISERAGLSAAATFGSIFTNTGRSTQQASEFSRTLVELAGDLASFNNTSVDDALLALRSGLSGEIEPLRRFQVFLTEATVAQRAMADTGKTSSKQLTQGEKILARYNLILEQTKKQQGDFARTSGGLANQQRELAAQIDNAAANMGKVLLPAATALVSALNDAFESGSALAGVLGDLAKTPPINIVVNFTTGGGRGKALLEHVILGGISPAALFAKLFVELDLKDSPTNQRVLNLLEKLGVDIVGGGGAVTFTPGPVSPAREAASGRATAAAAAAAAANAKAGQAAIDRVERQAREKSLRQQLADSKTRAAHLRDLIRIDPTNLKLQKRLGEELRKQASLRGQIAAAAKSAAEADRQAAASAKQRAEEAARQAKEIAKAQHEAAITRRNATQFQRLGLTASGERPVPGVGSLARRTRSLQDQIKGTPLDTKKTRTQLRRIARVLSGEFGKVGKDVRQAILDMLNEITGALSGRGTKGGQGPLTKTTALNTNKVLKGIGLSPEDRRELRARLSHFNSAGLRLSGAHATGRTSGNFNSWPNIIIDNIVTVEVGGKKLTATVTKEQQRRRRGNPLQKRGPNRAGTGGH